MKEGWLCVIDPYFHLPRKKISCPLPNDFLQHLYPSSGFPSQSISVHVEYFMGFSLAALAKNILDGRVAKVIDCLAMQLRAVIGDVPVARHS